jgi:hypothetical protein
MCDQFTKSFGKRYSASYEDPVFKMRIQLPTGLGILLWVTFPSTSQAKRCLTSVIKWVPVGPARQDSGTFIENTSFFNLGGFINDNKNNITMII